MKQTAKFLFLPLLLIGFYGIWGIQWGLPSAARTRLFLNPQLNNPEFFAKVAKARNDLYTQMGGNHVAYFGRLARQGEINRLPTLLNSYGSYLIKTHSIDESGTLVMLSKMNPLKNQWYPYSFVYGGAYLFPLGVYMGILHLLNLIEMVPSPVFYYTHPEAISAVFTALRLWSVIGFLAACLAVFMLGEGLIGPTASRWAMVFFGLVPTCIAHTKFGKPHTWAAALSLWSIYFAVKAKENPSRSFLLVGSSLLFGLAMGMTVTQVVFFPFLLWALWSNDWRTLVRRGILTGLAAAAAFLATNFYLLAHFQDYLDEKFFLTQFAPFRPKGRALVEFFTSILRISLGWELWALSMGGFLWAFLQKEKPKLRTLAILLAAGIVYAAFQTQAKSGLPILSRLFLAMIGMLCIFASAATFSWARVGQGLRWACLIALLIKGAVYNRHLASDTAPGDNASLAAEWIHQNIPSASTIGHPVWVAQLDCFPPIDFSRYTVVPIASDRFINAKGPLYAAISPLDPRWKPVLLSRNFSLLRSFRESPLQKFGYEDPFTLANFPVNIYGRDLPKR